MDKILKNYQSNNKKEIPIQSKTISKRTRSNQGKEKVVSENQRICANKRERERTQLMNNMYEKLATKFKPPVTKQDILSLSKKYLEFLYMMNNDEEFFRRYSMYELKKGFYVYQVEMNLQR